MLHPADNVPTLIVALGGSQLTCFATGVSNRIRKSVSPTGKLCRNVRTLRMMRHNIDFDVGAAFESGASLADLGEALHERIVEVASGTFVTSELLNMRETAAIRIERIL